MLFKQHDKTVAEFIFKNYYKTAYLTALRYCTDSSSAEEIAQETIYKAIKNVKQLKDEGKMEAWIIAIAKNNALQVIKKNTRVLSIPLDDITMSTNENPFNIIESDEVIKVVQNIINKLDEPYKTTIYLYYYLEMKVREVANILEIPEGTVKTILFRGRAIVKKQLVKKGYTQELG